MDDFETQENEIDEQYLPRGTYKLIDKLDVENPRLTAIRPEELADEKARLHIAYLSGRRSIVDELIDKRNRLKIKEPV